MKDQSIPARAALWAIVAVVLPLQATNGQPLHYSKVPYVYTSDPSVFASLFFDAHTEAMRIAHCGDSNSEDLGGGGRVQLAWRRWLWHQHFGHTPGTQIIPSLSSLGGTPLGATWLSKAAYVSPLLANSSYPNTSLPPELLNEYIAGYSLGPNGRMVGGSGFYVQLNHNNDNEDSAFTGGSMTSNYPAESGFHYVEEAVGMGTQAFAAGTMFGGESFIDASAGLRLEVLALTKPGSTPDLFWALRPMTRLHVQQIGVMAEQSGVLFGGSQTLDAPVGAVRVAGTPPLAQLQGHQGWYQVHLAGNEEVNAPGGEAAWILGARFLSENTCGVIVDSLSHGGYRASDFVANHPDCGFVLKALGYDAAWLAYGTNDSGLGIPVSIFEFNLRTLIEFWRDAMNDPELPIILEAPPYRTNELMNGGIVPGQYYAGAMHQIASDTPNVMVVNIRRIVEERYGWGSGNEGLYLSDGVHYTAAGAEAIARSAVENVIDYLTPDCLGDAAPSAGDHQVDLDDLFDVIVAFGPCAHSCRACREDFNDDGVVDINDLFVVIGGWGSCD